MATPSNQPRSEMEAAVGRREREADAAAAACADDLASLMEEKFMGLLRARLARNGGSLDETDLADLGAEFRAQAEEIKDIFLEAVAAHARAHEQGREQGERLHAFQRLMVQRFEGRLVPDKDLDGTPELMSRRILPGFFSALALMLGKDDMARYQSRADELAERVRRRMGDAFTWREVGRTKEARLLTLSAEVHMSHHFANVEKRIDWLVALVNGSLIPLDPGRPGASWRFTDTAARHLLRDLFSDLRRNMNNAETRAAMAKRFGPESMARLENLVRALG